MTARAGALRDVHVVHALTMGAAPYAAPELAKSFRVSTIFIAPNVREAVVDGRADFVPIFLSEAPRLFADRFRPDWALVQLSPPDRHGFCSTGISGDVTVGAIRHARYVVAEINPRMPRTFGDTLVHVDRLHAITEVDRPLPEMAPPPISEDMRRISALIADDDRRRRLPADRDRRHAQRGAGEHRRPPPSRYPHGDADRRYRRPLPDGGPSTAAARPVMPGKIVCSFAGGTQALYDFVHDNPMVAVHGSEFTNDPAVIGQNDNVVAINSALQVDLTGQVDADSIGWHLFSGIGGQVDFIRGAARSRGGPAHHRAAQHGAGRTP